VEVHLVLAHAVEVVHLVCDLVKLVAELAQSGDLPRSAVLTGEVLAVLFEDLIRRLPQGPDEILEAAVLAGLANLRELGLEELDLPGDGLDVAAVVRVPGQLRGEGLHEIQDPLEAADHPLQEIRPAAVAGLADEVILIKLELVVGHLREHVGELLGRGAGAGLLNGRALLLIETEAVLDRGAGFGEFAVGELLPERRDVLVEALEVLDQLAEQSEIARGPGPAGEVTHIPAGGERGPCGQAMGLEGVGAGGLRFADALGFRRVQAEVVLRGPEDFIALRAGGERLERGDDGLQAVAQGVHQGHIARDPRLTGEKGVVLGR
jgi:hypothetical protein